MGGKLITFEGIDGCGKTTQIELTRQWLTNVSTAPIVVTREPGGTQLGETLRSLLLYGRPSVLLCEKRELPLSPIAELLLYAADRAQNFQEVILPALINDAIVLCDRGGDSTIAYQGYGRGMSLSLIHGLNLIATCGLVSNITLWLDVDVELGLQRTKTRGGARKQLIMSDSAQ